MAKLGRSVLDTKQVATSVAARQGSVVAVASAGAEGRSNLCRAVGNDRILVGNNTD